MNLVKLQTRKLWWNFVSGCFLAMGYPERLFLKNFWIGTQHSQIKKGFIGKDYSTYGYWWNHFMMEWGLIGVPTRLLYFMSKDSVSLQKGKFWHMILLQQFFEAPINLFWYLLHFFNEAWASLPLIVRSTLNIFSLSLARSFF